MKYDFNKITQRRGTNSYKWDSCKNDGMLPMWVADMDFETAPAIIDALKKRIEHGCFGYTYVPDEYYEAVISWFYNRHHWEIQKDWFIYTSGVVPAISAIIKALVKEGNRVLTLTPVYNCFFLQYGTMVACWRVVRWYTKTTPSALTLMTWSDALPNHQ